MKKIFLLVGLMAFMFQAHSQCSSIYKFINPTLTSGVYKFSNVVPSVDAYISQVGSVNATISAIDDSTVYPYAWQPFIQFTNSVSNATDSSYVEFLIEFKNGSAIDTQYCVEATAIDLDGASAYKEIIKSSLPVKGKASYSSSVSYKRDSMWFTIISSTISYSVIDTTNYDCMAALKYDSVQSFRLRIGVVGTISGSAVRQYSLYFKHFDSMIVSLPIKKFTKKVYSKPEEEIISVYYSQYGQSFEGTIEQFSKYAVPGQLYYDTRGKKYIVIK